MKGSGPRGPSERSLPTLRRDHPPAVALGKLAGTRPFRAEALTFAFSLVPLIAARRPDLIYLSEWDTARALARFRRVLRQPFKLLLCNGGFAWQGFEHLDHVQELTPAAREYVLSRGASPDRHTVLPLGFSIQPELHVPDAAERAAIRSRLRLPAGRRILVSVAALNRHHKRLDYVIEELAELPKPRPYLLLVGEPEAETEALRRLALERLGPDGHGFRTVPASEVPGLLRASDAFVLASLVEAQGRAVIEAASHGLPCFVHDTPVMRFALGEHGHFADLTRRGALVALLAQLEPWDPEEVRARHAHVYERFSWNRLRPRYIELFAAVANRTVSSSTGENVSRYIR